MNPILLLLLLILFAALYLTGSWLMKRRDRQKALTASFPVAWKRNIEKNLPPYLKLSTATKVQLHKYIQEFLYDKSFEGCGGLNLTDEIRVTIAAQACLLLLNKDVRCYPKLRTILVYPSTFKAGQKGMFVRRTDESSMRIGESWRTGLVVLAWDSVKQGAMNFSDGHNVAIHEFAHQLDQEDGRADGAPILTSPSAYSAWAKVLSREYDRLRKKSRKGKKTVMQRYGATSPAEFFAVASEAFFEKPRQMQKKHPALYKELEKFYKVNPIEWA